MKAREKERTQKNTQQKGGAEKINKARDSVKEKERQRKSREFLSQIL